MGRFFSVLALLAVSQPAMAGRMIRFASPLQSLTIPDPEAKEGLQTNRQRFLGRFKAGLQAEAETRRELAAQRTKELQAAAASGTEWAEKAADSERARRSKEAELVEQAYDKAVVQFEAENKKGGKKSKSPNAYQFVGVVNRRGDKPISWHARKKPTDAKWSVRLVHVNQDAIIKDLFNRGKIDIFAKYKNTGIVDEETKAPIVTTKYEVRERSIKYVDLGDEG
jgi:hypothetical protein